MSSLGQFVVFKEVADTGNVTQAAKHLHISQPSVSIQIQNLEQEYNVTLLERTNRGVLLTECGEIFYQYISQVIQAMREAQEVMLEHEAKQHRNVHVGATLTIGEYVVPFIADAMYHEHPQINLNVKVANTANMAEEVLDKQLHLALIEGPVPTNPDLIIENFWHDELVIVVGIDHPWSKLLSVSLNELKDERFIIREQGSGTRKVMENALQEGGVDAAELNITMELNSTRAIKQSVMSGLGVTIISALTVQRECRQKQLSMLRLEGCQLQRPLNILTHKRGFLTSDEQTFLSLIRNRNRLKEILPPPLLP